MKCPQKVKKNLELLENAWSNYQVYMNDEMEYIDEESLLSGMATRKA